MSSQFFGLNIAFSGLNAFQAAINTTANNVSNVETDGYSRQEVVLKASSSIRAWQKYGSVSSGVTAEEVVQIRDKYYDQKYWQNQSSYGQFDSKLYYMRQIEDYFTDTAAAGGFTTIFTSMFNSMDMLKSNPMDSSVRAQFVNDAEKLSRFFNQTTTSLSDLQTAMNDEIKAQVDNINAIAQKVAMLNKQINTLEVNGSNANELRDERALLIDELSVIAAVEVQEDVVEDPNFPDYDTGLTIFNVKLNGQLLVGNFAANPLTVVTREKNDNIMDVEGLYDIQWAKTGVTFNPLSSNQNGRLKALYQLRDGNDGFNTRGVITETGMDDKNRTTLKMEGLNYSDIESLSLPPSGMVTIKNIDYEYESFDVTTTMDEETGEISMESITFHLKYALNDDKIADVSGASLQVGSKIDYKGIPYYQNQMNNFIRNFAKAFNDIQINEGEDLYGNRGQSFFVAVDAMTGKEKLFGDLYAKPGEEVTFTSEDDTYYGLTSKTMWVNSAIHDDLKLFSTATYKPDEQGHDDATLIDRLKTLYKDEEIYRKGGAKDFLECIYSDVTVDTREAEMFQEYYTNIQTSIDKQRKSVSGVDEDEEAQNLMKFQNAYNLSSKVISVLAEMYDQLILNTAN